MGTRAGWGGTGRGGVGGGKNYLLGHSMSSQTPTRWAITHKWATQPVGANTGPHCPVGTLHGPIVLAMTLEGQQNAIHKADQLTFNT